jgi:elongation factor P
VIATSDFRKGLKLEYKNDPYEIVDFQHVKMGRGGAVVKTKMKNMRTGAVIEETIRSGEKFPPAGLEEKKMQFLYVQDSFYYFMDQETFEQVPFSAEQLGDTTRWLKDNTEVKVLFYKGTPLNVESPNFVELTITKTDPSGFKGDTASGGGKPATLETGAVVRVPFHLSEGDMIKVDTRTSEYIERVK